MDRVYRRVHLGSMPRQFLVAHHHQDVLHVVNQSHTVSGAAETVRSAMSVILITHNVYSPVQLVPTTMGTESANSVPQVCLIVPSASPVHIALFVLVKRF